MNHAHDLHLIKRSGKLFPATERDKQTWDKVPKDVTFRVHLQVPRNPKHHKWSWTLADLLADNWQGDYRPSSDEVMRYLKMRTGLVEVMRDLETGEDVVVPSSTSFSAMDQTSYQEWFDKALKVASAVLGVSVEELAVQAREDGLEGRCQVPECTEGKAVHRHHLIPGTAGRARSEKLGLVINLCQRHHAEAHGTIASKNSKNQWEQIFCDAIGKDYSEAVRAVRGDTKLYKLKENMK